MDAPHKSTGIPDKDHGKTALSPFISVARAQAFDMLLHLSLNLPQPILVAGATGIGKTRYLRTLEKQAAAYATTCYLMPAAGLSLERLLDTVRLKAEIDLQVSGHSPSGTDLDSLLELYAKNRRTLLLILDDAEGLLPGFLDALGQYAAAYPALKWVVALDDNGVREREGSDPFFINEAFQFEIPPLDRNASAAYVHHLMAESSAFLPGETLGDVAQEEIFQVTGGNPGQIDSYLEQPHVVKRGQSGPFNVGVLAGTGLLIAVMAGTTLYFGRGFFTSTTSLPNPSKPASETGPLPVISQDSMLEVESLTAPNPVVTPASSPEASLPVLPVEISRPPTTTLQRVADNKAAETRGNEKQEKPQPTVKAVVPAPPIHPEPEPVQKPKTEVLPAVPPAGTHVMPLPEQEPPKIELTQPSQSQLPEPATAPVPVPLPPAVELQPAPERPSAPESPVLIGDNQWITAQKPERYTLQIATVASFPLVEKVVTEHPAGRNWSAAALRQDGGERYQVYQGVYPNATAALEARSRWPTQGKQALIRSFASIQQALSQQSVQDSPLALMPMPAPEAPAIRPQQLPEAPATRPQRLPEAPATRSQRSPAAPKPAPRKAAPPRTRENPVLPIVQPVTSPAGTEPAASVTAPPPTVSENKPEPEINPPIVETPLSSVRADRVEAANPPVTAARMIESGVDQNSAVPTRSPGEQKTLQVALGPKIEEPESNAGEETDDPESGQEIYYRLIEGQAPIAEIVNDQSKKSAPAPQTEPPAESIVEPVAPASGPAIATNRNPAIQDASWLLTQSPERYTLQVITVSSTRARDEVARRLPTTSAIASYPAQRDQGTVYPLFYGSYPDLATARKAMALLPDTLGSKPVPRQFKAIQREMAR